MKLSSLLERIRRARLVRVVAVYLGASWGVLQIADTLSESLALPPWVSPVAIILLLVGFVIITATAWVQSLPATTAAEEAGEVPSDWEIAPADAVASLKSGRLPHLTWARAIMGGVVALSLLFTGAYLFWGGESFIGPSEAAASDAPEGIAILPFKVTGLEDDAFWGEGMVDLLATNLDGMGGYRTIDARTVLARWDETVGATAAPDLRQQLTAAGRTGARHAVVGSAVGVGADLRLATEVYDLTSGREIGRAQVQGSEDDPMALIDQLSLETMRALLSGEDANLATSRNLANLTTASLPALRAYLEGERFYRQAAFPQAVDAYERALEEDSTFALAIFRLSDTYGWMEAVNSETAAELGARSMRYRDRLSARNAVILTAGNALYTRDLSVVPQIEAAARKYPDDPEAQFMLAEVYIHLGEATGATLEDGYETVLRAIRLDPRFAPYYIHAIDASLMLGDLEAYRRHLDAYTALVDEDVAQRERAEYAVFHDLLYGDEDVVASLGGRLDALDDRAVHVGWGTFGVTHDRLPRLRWFAEYMRSRTGQDGWWSGLARWSVNDGRWTHGLAMLRDSLPGGPDPVTVFLYHALTDVELGGLLDVIRACEMGPGCTLQAGALAAEEGDWPRHEAAVAHARAAADALRADGDPVTARQADAVAEALEGYAELVRGEPAIARVTLARAQGLAPGSAGEWARLWLARADEELGRHRDALRWYGLSLATFARSHAHHRRAKIAERMGDVALARAEWEALLENLADAEPADPRPAEARAALARLAG